MTPDTSAKPRRRETIQRATAALLGGGALCFTVAGVLALITQGRAGAAYLALVLSLVIMPTALLWAFTAPTVRGALLGLLVPAAGFGGIIAIAGGLA